MAKPAKHKTADEMSLLPAESGGDRTSRIADAAEVLAMRPLAERMRPRTLNDMVGQRRLLAPGSALRRAVESGRVHSMILWGPPGCGKTTLALLLARYADAEFVAISAVLSGLPQVREVLAEAQARFDGGRRTVLFVDEVHRFNKAQQDAFLPHIERGTIIFVGATTENPSFELNSALLSRCRVHVLEAVSADDIVIALRHAVDDGERGLRARNLDVTDAALREIAGAADGDVRRALTLLEIAADIADGEGGTISEATLHQVLADRTRRFDKGGDQFYDQISALHKCVRSSNPDAALYWLARMLDGGADPAYLARRLTRMAVEDRPIYLRLTIEGRRIWFEWSYDGEIWTKIGPDFDTTTFSDEYCKYGEFTGTMVGIAVTDAALHEKTADFDFFDYEADETKPVD